MKERQRLQMVELQLKSSQSKTVELQAELMTVNKVSLAL